MSENIYNDIRKEMTTDERKRFDKMLEKLYTDGFETGYDFSENEKWIRIDESLPQTPDRVDVTVQLRTGRRKCVAGRYEDGRWKGAAGKYTVIAWRPASKPYTDEPAEEE